MSKSHWLRVTSRRQFEHSIKTENVLKLCAVQSKEDGKRYLLPTDGDTELLLQQCTKSKTNSEPTGYSHLQHIDQYTTAMKMRLR